MSARGWLSAAAMCAVVATSCRAPARVGLPDTLAPEHLTLAGEFNIPPSGRFPPAAGPPFGGISGLAPLGDGRWLAVCDERDGSRVYRLRVSGEGADLRVAPEDVIALEVGGLAPPRVDAEAVAVTTRGTMMIASEGAGNELPRVPPALLEYDIAGRFVRQLELRERFVPTPAGAPTRGARDNAAFESLTIAPGGGRLFAGMETALVQDGEPAAIGRGSTARILEDGRAGDSYRPRREFAYQIEPVEPPPFVPAVTISGLVELLALGSDDLLALERTYLAARRGADAGGPSLNRIRIFRLSLADATDVSGIDSLAGATFTPVRKTLLLDLGSVTGLSADLATLENFEALTFGPRLGDGSRSLVLASDDNFHSTQRTSFLLFRIGTGK